MKDRLMIVVFGILAATASLAAAGEAPRDGGARLERAMDRIRENAPPDIAALLDKRQQGQKLTREEQQKLKEYVQSLRK